MTASTPEGIAKRAILDALERMQGVRVWHNRGGMRGHMRFGLAPGSADLVGLVRLDSGIGRFFALEVKARGGKVSAEQQAWIDEVRALGGFAAVVTTAQEAVDAVLMARATDLKGI